MELILNGVNGRYLRNILENGKELTTRVDAAVAYASDAELLFDWCWHREKPLRFWGRFDDQVPISVPILERFLARKSARYVCKLVRKFHPKVIWWRGYGAYVGSANLSPSAWWTNFEAGVFFTEEELGEQGFGVELEALFDRIDQESSPLTDELLKLIQSRQRELAQRQRDDEEAAKRFVSTDFVRSFSGLAQTARKSAADRQREAFLTEWQATLQLLRDIASKVSGDDVRPKWIAGDAPSGAQADQFLHAHYYQNTFDEAGRARYEDHFERNRSDPDRALEQAIRWWKGLPKSPGHEDIMLNETAPWLRQALDEEQLMKLTEGDFIEVLGKVHASADYARRAPNASVGLPGGQKYTIPQKVDALGRKIWRSSTYGTPAPIRTLVHVLYGGAPDAVAQRLWEAIDPGSKWKVDGLGVSSLGEIVGWAMPEQYPPRNGRTSKALRSLGYPVKVHVGA